MWYGRSGYAYRARLSCHRSIEAAAQTVTEFFVARRAEVREQSAGTRIRFSRGKRPWSWFSISETRQPQSIDVTLSGESETTVVSIEYHVTNAFGAILAPCMFTREVADLRAEMETP
jgi:hypothetical protein